VMLPTRANRPHQPLPTAGHLPVHTRLLSVPRLLGYWFLLAGVMSANGIFRELALVPLVGRTRSGVLSAALGMTCILAVTRVAYRPYPDSMGERAKHLNPASVSGAWLVMTVAFEELFGHYVDGKRWTELAANYALWRGQLWPLVLFTVGIAPFLWGRWRIPHGRDGQGSLR
jgi:hypothetical protein